MDLLVSVRNAAEARKARAGGAAIVDAKEPSLGALGPVEPEELARIAREVAPNRWSAALGDPLTPAEAARLVEAAFATTETPPAFLKLGFAGVRTGSAEAVLRRAVSAAAGRAAIVAVAYADAESLGAPAPDAVADAAARAGAAGVLLDTALKEGPGLLGWYPPDRLERWVAALRKRGLWSALAGRLVPEDLPRIRDTGAAVVGVRGAACRGGREGTVDPRLVERLTRLLDGSLNSSR